MSLNHYWRERRYLDLWSVNHALSGVVIGAFLFKLGVPFGLSLLGAVVLFVGWELAEALLGIEEHASNIMTDVALNLVGFLLTAYYFFILGKPISWTAAWMLLAVFMALNLWGFIAYEKRKLGIED